MPLRLPSTSATSVAIAGVLAWFALVGTPASADSKSKSDRPALADAPQVEQDTLKRMLAGESWARRAVAAMRLERYGCEQSAAMLQTLLTESAWQVRTFAIRSLAHRQAAFPSGGLETEEDPRVIRAALRYGYSIDPARLQRGVRTLARSNSMRDKMLAAELGATGGSEELNEIALEAARQVILRMNRTEAGALSPRLALLTGQTDIRRPYQWQQWLTKTGRNFKLNPGLSITKDDPPLPMSLLGRLDAEQFVGMETYMATLAQHEVDLAIALDCTASMSGEIMAAQGGIDDMMVFVGDVVASVRVALVAYRDRQDEFETKAWDFTDNVAQIREQLWQLSADGGGDHAEAVYPAIRLAFTQLNWRHEAQKVFVVVGDAPPHPGYGGLSENLARQARETANVATHMIQAKGKPVKHFAEIAEAGGGRCVTLRDADTLMAEITGLTLGDRYSDEFREFYRVYLELCR